MSKLAIHIQHFKRGAVGSIAGHNFYKRGDKDEHSNMDIDPERSCENVALVAPEGSFYQEVKGMVEGATGRVTKASVWVSEWIIYPPENLQDPLTADKSEVMRYFEDVNDWMISKGYTVPLAVVHFDETTVHGHFDTVPLTADGRLSRKDVYSRQALLDIHTELAAFLQDKGWDIQRGDSTAAKQIRAVSVPEYKKQAEAQKQELLKEIDVLQSELDTSKAEKEALKADIEVLKATLTPEQIEALEHEKGLFKTVKMPFRDYQNLKNTAAKMEEAETRANEAEARADDAEEKMTVMERIFDQSLEKEKENLNNIYRESLEELQRTHPTFQLKNDNATLRKRLEEEERKRKLAEEAWRKLQESIAATAEFAKIVVDVLLKHPEAQEEVVKEVKEKPREMVLHMNMEVQRQIDRLSGSTFARQAEIHTRLNYLDAMHLKYGMSPNQYREYGALSRELQELCGRVRKPPERQKEKEQGYSR